MTNEMDGPGITGFGYGNQGGSESKPDNERVSQPQAQPAPSPAAEDKQPASGAEAQAAHDEARSEVDDRAASAGAQADGEPELGEVVPLDFDPAGPVPGFEASASDCMNHALSIARSLNHAVLSSDHLMLALTMDQSARRLLNRVGDISRLRATAMRRLGRMHSRYAAGDPSQTADLADIRKLARAAAAEREQMVAISDLVNAFPRENDRLTYGAPKNTRTVALVETIEKGLVPRVSDAVTRIEAAVREATQGQRQTVQSLLEDLNARQAHDEQRQREFMDEIRRQVRESADIHFAAVVRDLDDKFAAKLAELTPPKPVADPTEPAVSDPPVETPAAPERKSYWSWIIL